MATERDRFLRGDEPRGFAYPIARGKEGIWPRRNADAIRRSSIVNILGTIPGERVGEPDFGSRLPLLIFEPNDEILYQAIVEETKGALQRWDPYIEVRGVSPEISENDIKIFIDYVDKLSRNPSEQRLVFSLRRN